MPTPQDQSKFEREILERLAALEARSALANTGLSCPAPNVTAVKGLLQALGFDGDLDAGDVGTTGWALGANRAALPEVLLRPGSLGNDLLTNPTRGDAAYTTASGFGVTLTGTVPLASQSWFAPAGFTTCTINATARVYAINNTPGLDYLYARARVFVPSSGGFFQGLGLPLACSGNNGSGLNVSPVAARVENLAEGDEIRIEVQGWTAFAGWAADASNQADVGASLSWTR